MAIYFSFPGASANYTLPSGDTMRIVIRYDMATAGLTSTNIDVPLLDPGVLNIPLEVSPSGNTFRFSFIDIAFQNQNDVFTSASAGGSGYPVFNSTFADDTYIDVYLNGSIFWQGMVDFSNIKREQYRLNSAGSLVYEKVKFRASDVLSYFWTRSVTLSDVSYSDGMELTTLLQNIIGEVGYGSGDLTIDANFEIVEESGATYEYRDLYISNISSSTEVSFFLKNLINGTASFLFNMKGKVYFVQRTAGTTTSVGTGYMLDFSRRENANAIDYISLQATIDTDPLTYGDFHAQFAFNSITFAAVNGTESKNSKANVSIDATGAINHLFTVAGGTAVVPGGAGYTASSGSDTSITDTGINYETLLFESGDQVNLIDDSTTTFLEKLTATDTMQITDCGVTVALNDHYNVYRGYDGTDRRRYKIYRIINQAAGVYAEYFQTSRHLFGVKLRDISAWSDLSKRYTIGGVNYRAKSAKFKFSDDTCDFELVRVS